MFNFLNHVTGKGKHVYPGLHNGIDDAGKLRMIYLGNGGHNDAANAGLVDTAYFFQCAVEGPPLTEPVMSFPQAIQRELILLTAQGLQCSAHPIGQMKGVPHDRKGDGALVKQL